MNKIENSLFHILNKGGIGQRQLRYLAVKDPLYLTLIYKPFLFNPYFKVLSKSGFKGETFQDFIVKNLPDPEKDFREKKWNNWG